jgi:hypothetical protein
MLVEEFGSKHLPLRELGGGMRLAQGINRSQGLSCTLGLCIWNLVTSLAPHMAERLGGEQLSPSLSGIA